MTTSEQINEIAKAMVNAQTQLKNAALNKVNPHFRSKYADLAGIRDTVTPILTAHGIAVVQTLDHYLSGPDGQAGTGLYTRLVHTSGQWIESMCPIPAFQDMQKMGSAITYARRYSLSAICGIAADEDDDANEASQPPRPAAVAKAPVGYEDWLIDLEATALLGVEALKVAWENSKVDFRKHLMATELTKWESLKRRAVLVKASA